MHSALKRVHRTKTDIAIVNQTTLTHSTGYEPADSVLEDIVTCFEDTFPTRVVGYYVEGSYADQTAITTSDLDLTIVFRTGFANGEEAAADEEADPDGEEGALDLAVDHEAGLERLLELPGLVYQPHRVVRRPDVEG